MMEAVAILSKIPRLIFRRSAHTFHESSISSPHRSRFIRNEKNCAINLADVHVLRSQAQRLIPDAREAQE
jgi:hypothetical protein